MPQPPTILVTGATDGLGQGVALELARRGASVLVHGRDDTRIARTLDLVHRAAPDAQLRGYRADFAALDEVRELAQQIVANEARIEVLVNNAGIGSDVPGGPERQESRDGYELRFAVNYLAPYLLTHLLLPLLRLSTPARIVNVSSLGQQAIDFDDVMLTQGYSGTRAYCQSKLAQILFTFDLAELLAGSGVTATALHPATYMPTKIVPSPSSSLEEGVNATVRLAVADELAAASGEFYDGIRERKALAQAYDLAARKRLRELSNELTGVALA